jgi:hypothetical protein
VWLAKPDNSRTEFQVGDETVTAVFIGRHWWGWSPSRGFVTNNGAPNHGHGFGPAEALIDPARHLASLQLGDVAMVSFRERQAFQVTALPRTDDEYGSTGHFRYLVPAQTFTSSWLMPKSACCSVCKRIFAAMLSA